MLLAVLALVAVACWLGDRLLCGEDRPPGRVRLGPGPVQSPPAVEDEPGWTALDDHQLTRLLRDASP